MTQKIKMQGFKEKHRVDIVTAAEIDFTKRSFDGMRLTELQIDVIITSARDVEKLMNVLEFIKPCFQ